MPTYLADSIPGLPAPFSGPRYAENVARHGKAQHCVICGQPVKQPEHARWLNVADGGRVFVSELEAAQLAAANDASFMGGYPIGPECWRKHAQAFNQLEQLGAARRNP